MAISLPTPVIGHKYCPISMNSSCPHLECTCIGGVDLSLCSSVSFNCLNSLESDICVSIEFLAHFTFWDVWLHQLGKDGILQAIRLHKFESGDIEPWKPREHHMHILTIERMCFRGNIFIYSGPGCIGGMPMSVSFSIYGWVMLLLPGATYYYARLDAWALGNDTHIHTYIHTLNRWMWYVNRVGNWRTHREYAIRLWGQGIASLLYRLWHVLAYQFGYEEDNISASGFRRPLDQVMIWWFFVPNLFVTEAVVFWIRKKERNNAIAPVYPSHTQAQAEPTKPNNSDHSMAKYVIEAVEGYIDPRANPA